MFNYLGRGNKDVCAARRGEEGAELLFSPGLCSGHGSSGAAAALQVEVAGGKLTL